MKFTVQIHGGARTITIIVANVERVLYHASGHADGNIPVTAANCCMSRAGFERRFPQAASLPLAQVERAVL